MFPNLFFHSKIYWDRLEREKKKKEEREKAEEKDVDISHISISRDIFGMTWFLDVIQIYGKHPNWIIL